MTGHVDRSRPNSHEVIAALTALYEAATHGSFLAASIFLAASLLAADLVMLNLRRGGDRPTTVTPNTHHQSPAPN